MSALGMMHGRHATSSLNEAQPHAGSARGAGAGSAGLPGGGSASAGLGAAARSETPDATARSATPSAAARSASPGTAVTAELEARATGDVTTRAAAVGAAQPAPSFAEQAAHDSGAQVGYKVATRAFPESEAQAAPSVPRRIEGLLTPQINASLSAGDQVLYSGVLYTARDAAHERLAQLLERGEETPFDLNGAFIYYAGPAPAKPGQVTGPVGPTSSYRMDPYTPTLLKAGVKGVIGKGRRGQEVKDALAENGAVYFAAVGGIAALMAKCVVDSKVVCYEDLGTEAVRAFLVEDLPLTVAVDCKGGDVYEAGPAAYLASLQG